MRSAFFILDVKYENAQERKGDEKKYLDLDFKRNI